MSDLISNLYPETTIKFMDKALEHYADTIEFFLDKKYLIANGNISEYETNMYQSDNQTTIEYFENYLSLSLANLYLIKKFSNEQTKVQRVDGKMSQIMVNGCLYDLCIETKDNHNLLKNTKSQNKIHFELDITKQELNDYTRRLISTFSDAVEKYENVRYKNNQKNMPDLYTYLRDKMHETMNYQAEIQNNRESYYLYEPKTISMNMKSVIKNGEEVKLSSIQDFKNMLCAEEIIKKQPAIKVYKNN